jgi:hypothetical protein
LISNISITIHVFKATNAYYFLVSSFTGLTRGAAQAGQKGDGAGEAARTHGRGVSEGGFTLAIP